MLVHSSDGGLVTTFDAHAHADRRTAHLLRWLILGAAGLIALVLALSHPASVGAAAPATYDNTICINYFTCYNSATGAGVPNTNSGYPMYTIPNVNSGYPSNTAVAAPYFDNRYGFVQVVTDGSGNLIDINPATGQRIFPFLPDFGFGAGFVGPSYINSNVTFDGTFPNAFGNNGCPVGNFSCLGFDSFFGFPFSTGVYSGNATIIAPGRNLIVVGPPFRTKEVAAPTVTMAVVTQPVAAPIAPIVATTGVAQPAAALVAPPAVSAPVPAAVNTATALSMSSAPAVTPAVSAGTSVHALSTPAVTAPTATTDLDDHRG